MFTHIENGNDPGCLNIETLVCSNVSKNISGGERISGFIQEEVVRIGD